MRHKRSASAPAENVRNPNETAKNMKHLIAAALAFAAPAVFAQQESKADLEAVQRAVHVCASCHGAEGRSTIKLAPSLAAQQREYTIRQLKDFRSQKRAETDTQAYMWGISALLTDEVIVGIADYYAAQQPAKPRSTNPKLEAAGKKIFMEGVPGTPVRACASCHNEDAAGEAGFPRLAGLNADYVFKQLQAFGTPLRPHGVVMKNETRALTPAQLRALAAYVQSL
jgi:cytochrome c553